MPKIITDEKLIEHLLTRGVENIYPDRESLKKLLLSGQKIRLYYGIDPTAPTLHLGHLVQLLKLKKFQALGHEVIILIGDFTAQIGDPTDKQALRKPLTHRQVLNNARGYKKQIGKILDLKKLNLRFLYNEKWTNKLNPQALLALASYFTVSRLLARDMFQARIKAGREIHLHEFLYPIFQAYDAVTLDVDLQLGGNDQMFNMLAGRDLMKKKKNKEMFVLTTKLLADPSGKKMGKSEGNVITLADSPADMYGKVMSWPDEMIVPGFEILTDLSDEGLLEVKDGLQLGLANPRDFKMKLAYEIVKIYQGTKAAATAEENFKRVFQEKQKPLTIPEIKIKDQDGKIGVLDLFTQAGLTASNGEARRLIGEKALRINDVLVAKVDLQVVILEQGLLLQRGKKQFIRASKK